MLFNQPKFYRFLREERQFCAVLAHLLMQKSTWSSHTFETSGTVLGHSGSYREKHEMRLTDPNMNSLFRYFIVLGYETHLKIDFNASTQDFNRYFISNIRPA